jgi:cytochrome c553
MRRSFASLSLALIALAGCHTTPKPKPSVPAELAWAYPAAPVGPFPDPGPPPYRVPGSNLSLTRAEIANSDLMRDWYPDSHPKPPPVVASGVRGAIACGACHLANGTGFIGAADIAGLPQAYIIEQIRAFRSGARGSAQPDRPDTVEMIKVARKIDDAHAADAAAYYSGLPRYARYRVIETDMVPGTHANHYGWLDLTPGAPAEPIKGRIIEVPEDVRRMFIGDDRTHVIDYVPKGAIASGQALVRSGGPGGLPCTSCHGSDLRGTGGTPGLAGRAATYLARQLWDIRTGARGGPSVASMQSVTANLTPTQIRDISAYLASCAP